MTIGVAIQAHDQFSATANNIRNQIEGMGLSMRQVARDNLMGARNIGLAMTVAGAAGLQFYRKSLDVGSEFYHTMESTRAVTSATQKEFEAMLDTARELSTLKMANNQQIASAMKYMGMAGFNPDQINKTIKAVIDLGTATGYRLEGKGGTADYMTNIMTAFQLRAEQSMRAADILTKTITTSNVDLDDIHDALRYSAADLTSIGSSLEEGAALIGVLGGAGIKGSMGGTAIGNMIQKLIKGMGEFRTARQSKILERMGLTKDDIVDAQGRVKGIIDIVESFRDRIKKMPEADRLDLMSGFFGRRGNRAFAALVKDSFLSMDMRGLYNEILTGAPGEASRIAKVMENTTKGLTTRLADTWREFQTTVFDAIAPAWNKILIVLRKIVVVLNKIAKHPVGKVMLVLGAVLAGVVTAAGALLVAISSIGLLLLTTEFSFKKLQQTGVWAWNSINAAMTRYMVNQRLMNQTQFTRTANGRWRDAATGRFVGKNVVMGMPLMGGFGKVGGKLGKFGSAITKALPFLTRLGPILGRLAGAVFGLPGLIATIVVSLIGFKNTLNILLFPLKLLGTILLTIAKFFTNGFRLGKAFEDANRVVFPETMKARDERRAVRQAYQNKAMIEAMFPNGSPRDAYRMYDRPNDPAFTKGAMDAYNRSMSIINNNEIQIDGETVQRAVKKNEFDSLLAGSVPIQ